MRTRATTIRLFVERCPAAVDFYEAGAPERVTDGRHVGTAAHEILAAVGVAPSGTAPEVVADAVVRKLLADGRSGVDAEPPLPPDDVFAGRDLALAWLAENPIPRHDLAWIELGIGLAADLRTVIPYADADVAFGSRPDLVEYVVDLDEDDEIGTIEIVDYKTSWQAGEDDLDTIQRRSQAIAVLRWFESRHPDRRVDAVRLVVANLRTRQRHERVVWRHEDTLDRWADDLAAIVHAAAARPGRRPKRPGVGCIGCGYSGACRPDLVVEADDLALTYTATRERADDLAATLREATKAAGPIPVPGGAVGYAPKARAAVRADAAERLFAAFVGDRVERGSPGFVFAVEALRRTLGVTGVRALAKVAHPTDREAREALVAECLDERIASEFGVHREVRGE